MIMHDYLHSSPAIGATLGAISLGIPDDVCSFLGKIGIGVVVALLSASAHALAKAFWKKVLK